MRFRITQPQPVEYVQVGSVQIPREFSAHVSELDGGEPDVDLRFEVRDGAPECREVTIRATDDGHEVRVSGLAGIRVQDVLERTLAYLFRADPSADEPGGTYFAGLDDRFSRLFPDEDSQREVVGEVRQARAARKVKITPELLQEVARVYRANVDDKPTRAVADHFDKAHRTGALYVQQAREAGLLGATTKGKAGEQ